MTSLTELIEQTDWTAYGLCRQVDPDLWYPPDHGGQQQARIARRICAQCPVTNACLEYALRHGETDGIWGGLTYRERLKLRRAS